MALSFNSLVGISRSTSGKANAFWKARIVEEALGLPLNDNNFLPIALIRGMEPDTTLSFSRREIGSMRTRERSGGMKPDADFVSLVNAERKRILTLLASDQKPADFDAAGWGSDADMLNYNQQVGGKPAKLGNTESIVNLEKNKDTVQCFRIRPLTERERDDLIQVFESVESTLHETYEKYTPPAKK